MHTTLDFPVQQIEKSKLPEVDFSNLDFGRWVADHMFKSIWAEGEWKNPEILPYGNLSLSPSSLALHYGQTVFEGMKAYRCADGRISIFRLEKHWARFNRSLDRMSMPAIPEALFSDALKQLVSLDRNWVPEGEGSSLYIRPFVFASEARLGVKIAEEYHFMIINAPVGPYYPRPLRVKVERTYTRAAEGGTGYAKCGGNYGGAFYPTAKARKDGYDQVIWTNACGHEYIEEAGTMNLMFVIDGTLITPPTSSSVLEGITRDSILILAEEMQIPIEVRNISVQELQTALKEGRVQEAFGAGTAAVVAPIHEIGIDGIDYKLPDAPKSACMYRFRERLSSIRKGLSEDFYQWNTYL